MSVTALAPTSGMSLYVLSEELQCLVDTAVMVDEGTIEREDLDRAILRFQAALPQKVDSVGYMLAHLETQAELAAAEIKRLQARKESFTRAIERLEGYCVTVLEKLPEPQKGPRKLEGQHCTLSIRPSDATVIQDAAAVPLDYKTVTIQIAARVWALMVERFPQISEILAGPEAKTSLKYSVDVKIAEVRRALKSGMSVPGADLEFKNHLRRT